MPMTTLPIPETIESVSRPVTLDIVREVMRVTGISSKTNIAFYGDMGKAKQLNSSIDDQQGDDPNVFANNDRVEISVSENFYGDRVPNEAMFQPENLLVFNDPALNIIMKPMYSAMEVNISVKYRASNKGQAIKWRDMVKARISQHKMVHVHNATYNFGVPRMALEILKYLHGLRENVAGYGDKFEEYFDQYRLPKMTQLTNQSGSAFMWVVPETQAGIQGWFDFDLPDEASKEGEAGAVATTFTYRFYYQRPTALVMVYPLQVHNQLIDYRYRDFEITDHNDVLKEYSQSSRLMLPFEGAKLTEQMVTEWGYAIPTFDEFMPISTPIKSRRLITAMLQIDGANPQTLLNLGELGQKQFTDDMLAYLKAERAYLTHPGGSAIDVTYYKGRSMIDINKPSIIVDEDLNVIAQTPINLREQHHVRIGLLIDWYLLKGDALSRMEDHGRAAIAMLLAIDPSLYERGYLPELIGDNFVSKSSLLTAMQNIRPLMAPVGSNVYRSNTVQILFVDTTRQENLAA